MKVIVIKSFKLFSLFIITSAMIVLGSHDLSCQDSTIKIVNNIDGYYNIKRNMWSAGIYAGILLNSHFVDFHKLPTIPSCCPDYKTGFGLQPTFGGLFDYKFSEEYNMTLELRASYANLGGTILAEEREWMYYDPTTSVEGLIEHTIESSINAFSIQPIFKLGIFENSSLHFGFSLGMVSSTYFKQKETLIEPKDLRFENDQRIRMVYSGEIPNSSDFYSSITGGINYDLMLTEDKNWYASPELFIDYSLNNLISNENWDVLSVRLAVALNYNGSTGLIRKYEEFRQIDTIKIEVPSIAENMFVPGVPVISYDTLAFENTLTVRENYYRVDTLLTKPEYVFTVSLKTTALESNGNEITSPNLEVEEFLATKMQPLLNYVFFDSNSFAIPERYNMLDSNDTKDFTMSKAFTDKELGFYYNILNIIGMKMRQNPKANLTLTGCNTNLYLEKNNLTLSKNRAQSVKDYLTNIWKLDEKRITVKPRNLPGTPSNNKALEGNQENRRVEIFSNDFKITSSIIARDTLIETTFTDLTDTLKKLNFGGFRFYTTETSGIELKNWKLSVIRGTDTIKTFEGTGPLPVSHDWILSKGKDASEIFTKPLIFSLAAVDVKNKEAIALDKPNIELKSLGSKRINKLSDIKIDSYSMMLFEFGSAKFTEENKDFPKLVNRLLSKDSKVKVLGYSDRLGNDDFNLKLSSLRAKAVSESIGHPNSSYQGLGETMLLYNNDLPEGRFYCRTVDIIVETPIHW